MDEKEQEWPVAGVAQLLLWSIFFLICMVAMVICGSRKKVVIASQAIGQPLEVERTDEIPVAVISKQDAKGYIEIALPRDMKAENVILENRYIDKEVLVLLKSADSSALDEPQIVGDIGPIRSCSRKKQSDGVLLTIQMDEIQEYVSTMENATLTISWKKPSEVYEHVLVLDAQNDSRAACVTGVAEAVRNSWNLPEVGLYLIRREDRMLTGEEKLDFVRETGADLYVLLDTASDEDADQYGIQAFYNKEYYIPDFGNAEFADALTRNVTIAVRNRAVGIFPCQRDSLLYNMNMLASRLCVGYLTNEKEQYLLNSEEYEQALAEGVRNAVNEAVTRIDEMNTQMETNKDE